MMNYRTIYIFLLSFSFCCINCKSSQNLGRARLKPPLKFLVLGDSMIGGYFGLMLVKELNKITGVKAKRIFAKSTGLSEYVRYNWGLKTQLFVKKYKPQILVVMFGSNDGLALRLRSGKLVYFHHREWRKIYALRVYIYLRLISPTVKKIYFIGQPSTDHKFLAPRYVVLNEIFRKETKKFPNVTFIPVWKWTSADGRFVTKMMDNCGVIGLVKYKNDPIHHSAFGGRVLTELFLDFIKMDVDLE